MKKGILLTLPLLLILAVVGRSQEVTGNLEGWVMDSNGEPLVGVTILIEGTELQGLRKSATDDYGYFRVFALPVGSFVVKVTHAAYQEVSFQNVIVYLGKTTTLGEINLKLKEIEAHEIVVIAERPLLDPITATLGANLQANAYEVLPIERNFRSIISLLPQANESYLGDETNVAGSTGLENIYFIDGINVTGPYRASTSTNLPYNFVKEIEIKEGGYEAEYGRALGGIVNVITYSGGNEFHGNVFGYFTNSKLAGEPRFGLLDARVDSFSTYDAGFSLGGPIVHDKLWFFAAYNRSYENQDIEIPEYGIHPDRKILNMFAAKITWQASEQTNVVFAIFGDPLKQNRAGWSPRAYASPSSLENPDPFLSFIERGGINLSLSARTFLGSKLFLDASVARYEGSENVKGDTEIGRIEPLFVDMTTNTWSGGVGDNQELDMKRTSAKLSATLVLNRHTFKAGLDYEDNFVHLLWVTTPPGIIEKISPTIYRTLFWQLDTVVHYRIPSFFLQDSWLVTNRFRLNVGLRWDGNYWFGSDSNLAQTITNQFQPRIGFIFQPGTLGTQKLFGSYGRFYQQIPLYTLGNWFSQMDNYYEYFNKDPREPDAVPILRIGISADDPYQSEIEGLEGQHFDEFIAGYERAFANHFKFGIRGIYRVLNQIIGIGGLRSPPVLKRGNPGKGDLSFLPEPKRNYAALELTVERIGARKLNFTASYVFSRNYGNYSGLYNSEARLATPNNNFSLQLEEQIPNSTGLLPNDRTHVFKLFGWYQFHSRFTIGTFFILQTGTPLNEFGATWVIYRPKFLVERGSAGRTPAIWDLNLRFTYDLYGSGSSAFKGQLILDLLHVGNPRKVVDIDQIHFQNIDLSGNQINPNPNFGSAMRYQSPMTFRIGFEFAF